MTTPQISIFIENKAGGLAAVTSLLAEKEVNLRALSIAESTDFGILRLIVEEPEEAGRILQEAGQIYTTTQVLAVEVEDKPGSLAAIASILSDAGLSLDYAYAFFAKKSEKAYMVIRVVEIEEAEEILVKHGINVVGQDVIAGF